jgi:hypothetical protein
VARAASAARDEGGTRFRQIAVVGGKSHEHIIKDLGKALQRMYRYYPEWQDFSIYDDLMYVARMLAFQWSLAFRDKGKGVHVAIP